MTITGITRLYAILGDPLAKARTPERFNAMFSERNIDAVMVPAEVGVEGFAAVVAGFKRMQQLRRADPHHAPQAGDVRVRGRTARQRPTGRRDQCGAASPGRALGGRHVRRPRLRGGASKSSHRTERQARASDRSRRRGPRDGDGTGTGRNCLAYTAGHRSQSRQKTWQRPSVAAFPNVRVEVVTADRTIATSLPTRHRSGCAKGDPLPCDPSRIAAATVVTDVIPKPDITPLLTAAQARGCAVVTGREMVEGQVG